MNRFFLYDTYYTVFCQFFLGTSFLSYPPRVTVHSAPFAKSRFQRFPLLRSSFLLMKWRSLRTFMQADFHASMKSAHKNVRVNSNLPGCNSCVHSYEYTLFRTKISQHEYMKRVPFSSFSQKRPEASSFAAIALMDFFESFYCI